MIKTKTETDELITFVTNNRLQVYSSNCGQYILLDDLQLIEFNSLPNLTKLII